MIYDIMKKNWLLKLIKIEEDLKKNKFLFVKVPSKKEK